MTAAPSTGAPAAATPPHGTDLPNRIGWLLVGLITIAVLASWLPSLAAGLGDNHEGRILGRHALHIVNAERDGLAASGWLSDWSPYGGGPDGDQESYAHHPPLMNFGHYLTARLLPVDVDVAVRLFAYLTGVAALPLGAGVLRRLGFGWWPVLAATTAIAVTPLFWVYGRLHGNVSLLLAMTLLLVRLREDRPIPRGEVALAGLVSFAAVIAGYLGLAAAAVLGLWLLAARGLDRVTRVIGAAMAAGAAVTAGYVLAGTGLGGVADQVQVRTTGGGFTAAEFAERIGRWLTELLAGWWRWLLAPAAMVAGLVDRRSRWPVLLLGLVAVGYVVGLPNGSFVHDYWIFPLLLPVWFGTAALVTALGALAPRWHGAVAAGCLALFALVGVLGVPGAEGGTGTASAAGLMRSGVAEAYVEAPQDAGSLVRDVPPAGGQQHAWRTAGLPAPRWHALYWQLPPSELTSPDDLDRVAVTDHVLVELARAPDWLGGTDAIAAAAEERRGGYAVLTGGALAELAASD